MRKEVKSGIVIIGLLLTAWCFGKAQGVRDNSRVFHGVTVPDRKDNPFWKDCTPLVDIPQAADGSQSSVCTNMKGQKYDLVLKPISRNCSEVTPKEKDGYQHFICSEQDELLFKPQATQGDTEKGRNLGIPSL